MMIPDTYRAGVSFHFHPSDGSVDATLPSGRVLTIRRDRYDDGWEIVGFIYMDGFRSDEAAEEWIVEEYGDEEDEDE